MNFYQGSNSFNKPKNLQSTQRKFLSLKCEYPINFDLNKPTEQGKFNSGVFRKTFSNCLVIMNLNWENIKASDLYNILRGFLPMGGEILRILILQEFNLVARENSVFRETFLSGGPSGKIKRILNENIQENQMNPSKAIKKKPKFAHVLFDSMKTAKTIYKTCNGLQICSGKELLDIRFVLKFSTKNFCVIESFYKKQEKLFSDSVKPWKNKEINKNLSCRHLSFFSSKRKITKSPFISQVETKKDLSTLYQIFNPRFEKKFEKLRSKSFEKPLKNKKRLMWMYKELNKNDTIRKGKVTFRNFVLTKIEPSFFKNF